MDYAKTPENTVRRAPHRGHYDAKTVHQIIDSALVCHVSFVEEGVPYIIPTLHVRDGESLLLHGATTSRLMQHIASGKTVCVAVTHIDALILAKSVFNHSVNYRSAVVFGTGALIANETEKMQALELFTEKLIAGRWQDSRPPSPQEMKATSIVRIHMDKASAKVRDIGVKNEPEDYDLPYWSGVIPIQTHYGLPIPDEHSQNIPLPEYLNDLD